MNGLAIEPFRSLGVGSAVPNDFVVPFYLRDTKRRISVARVGGRLFAFDDLCPCASPSCPLSGGLLEGKVIMCQCHGSRFDLETGAVIDGPSSTPIVTYDVREVRGEIEIRA